MDYTNLKERMEKSIGVYHLRRNYQKLELEELIQLY